jgi:dihydroorotase
MKNRDAASRRGFFWRASLAGRLLCGLTAAGEGMLSGQSNSRAPRYDLLVRGGRVVDPSQNLFDERDVAITGGRIAHVGPGIPESEARQVLNAKGKIVTSGLIDVHVHVYDEWLRSNSRRSELRGQGRRRL